MQPTNIPAPVSANPNPGMEQGTLGFAHSLSDTDTLRYAVSFGNLRDKTVYLDAQKGIDIARQNDGMEIKSALQTTSPLMATGTTYSATSGSIPVLLPTWVDRNLYDITKRDTPLASGMIPRVTNNGLFADYVRRTAVPTAVWQQEGTAKTSQTSTYDRNAQAIKFAYAVGEVSGPMLVASKIWQDALQNEIQGHYMSLKYLEENTIINGDTTSETYTYAWNGLIAGTSTNTSDMSGTTEITLSHLDTAAQTIREAYGHPNLIITDWRTYYRLKRLMRDYVRHPSPSNVMDWGFETMMWENIPIIPDLFMPTTATERVLLMLDTQTQNNIQLRVLQDATFEELAKTADSYKFMIKEYLTMIIIYESWCYKFYDLP